MIPPIFDKANIIIIRIQYTIPYLKLKKKQHDNDIIFVDTWYEIMVFLRPIYL